MSARRRRSRSVSTSSTWKTSQSRSSQPRRRSTKAWRDTRAQRGRGRERLLRHACFFLFFVFSFLFFALSPPPPNLQKQPTNLSLYRRPKMFPRTPRASFPDHGWAKESSLPSALHERTRSSGTQLIPAHKTPLPTKLAPRARQLKRIIFRSQKTTFQHYRPSKYHRSCQNKYGYRCFHFSHRTVRKRLSSCWSVGGP